MAHVDEATEFPGQATAILPSAEAGPTWARPLIALSDVIDHLTEACYVVATAAFLSVMLLGVFFRYVLNSALYWSDELALIIFVWATFLSIAAGYRHDRHVNIDFLVMALPPVWRKRAELLAEALAGAYIIALLVSSLTAFPVIAQGHSAALEWPVPVFFSAIPVACTIMLIHWIRRNVISTTLAATLLNIVIILTFFTLVYLPFGQYVQLTGLPRLSLLALSFFIPLLIGVPVAFAIGMVATMYIAVFGTVPFDEGARQISYGIEILALMAIPLLILSGNLMHAAGIAQRLVNFAQVLVGRVRGGLGASAVVASLIFADMSGSPVSDTAAIGSVLIPQMKQRGYRADFCAALLGASGTLGTLFPPAVTLLLYAIVVNVSVAGLFAASIGPGFLVALSFMIVAYLHARRYGYPREHVPRHLMLPRILGAAPGLFAVVVVIGGILGGVVTTAEVGAILLAYVLLLAVFIYRTPQPQQLYRTTVEAGYVSGMTLFLISTSVFLGFVLTRDLVSFVIVDTVTQLTSNTYAVIFLVNVVFIILGMVLEPAAIIFAFLPSFIPLLKEVGVDPVHWGVLFALNMALGCLVPPVALNLFVSTLIAGVRYHEAVRACLPFIVILMVDLALVAVFPQIALFLPHVLFGYPLR